MDQGIPITDFDDDGRSDRRRRTAVIAAICAALIIAIVAAGVTTIMLLKANELPSRHLVRVDIPPPSPTYSPTPTEEEIPTEPTEYPVATLSGNIPKYDKPGGKKVGTVDGSWYGYQSILEILDEQDGFLKVSLQQRPNGSTAWVSAEDVEISTTPYHIVLNVKTHKVTLYKAGEEVFTAGVGVGKAATPTPQGHFFVTMQADSPSAGYGPFVVVISGHSEAIDNWQGSGDALVAFHGPLGSAARIGKKGAAISNGCIRMHLSDLNKFKEVLPGSPVDIISE